MLTVWQILNSWCWRILCAKHPKVPPNLEGHQRSAAAPFHVLLSSHRERSYIRFTAWLVAGAFNVLTSVTFLVFAFKDVLPAFFRSFRSQWLIFSGWAGCRACSCMIVEVQFCRCVATQLAARPESAWFLRVVAPPLSIDLPLLAYALWSPAYVSGKCGPVCSMQHLSAPNTSAS